MTPRSPPTKGSVVYYNMRAKEWRKLKKGMRTDNKYLGVMVEPPDNVIKQGMIRL